VPTPPTDLSGARITVMGLGRFGGGVGVTRWLVSQGADVLLTDLDPADKLTPSLDQIRDLVDRQAVRLRLGEHNASDFTDTDLVVANPAVPKPWDNRFLRAAAAAGVPITTEIRLLVERLPPGVRTIGITGSAGKSTTTAMIAHILRARARAGAVHLGGNIGGSLLSDLDRIRAGDDVVLELSSAMLYWLGPGVGSPDAPGWSPQTAVITNITPNHIDWHVDLGHYTRSKLNILHHQPDGAGAVINAALMPQISAWYRGRLRALTPFVRPDDVAAGWRASDLRAVVRLPGLHNLTNAAFALETVAIVTGDASAADAPALATFPGLPHRLQWVADIPLPGDGIARAYNDSKSTTPEAAILAIRAFADDPAVGVERVHLICGGYDKKIDLSSMAPILARAAGTYTIGATAGAIAQAVAAAGGVATRCDTLDQAVGAVLPRLTPGSVVVLSPACASWDQFTNFEERGARFEALVKAGIGPGGPSGGVLHTMTKKYPNTT